MRSLMPTLVLAAAMPLAADLPDPTRPADYRRAAPPVELALSNESFVLTGVKIGLGERSALVNGRMVRVGEQIAGARVLEIGAAEVVLDRDGQRITVPLLQRGVKRPAATGAEPRR